ncbi:MAG: hypothetical protein FJ100_21910 [Deltaproteobacteria bacterium]|nr:hypothetical protein [Deltaproteobacteria bacterium]
MFIQQGRTQVQVSSYEDAVTISVNGYTANDGSAYVCTYVRLDIATARKMAEAILELTKEPTNG